MKGLPARGHQADGLQSATRDGVRAAPRQRPAAEPGGCTWPLSAGGARWPGRASARGALGARINGGPLWGRCCPRGCHGPGHVRYTRTWSHASLVPITDGQGRAQGCLGWVSESSWALWPWRVRAPLKGRHRRHSLEQDIGAPFLATILPEPVGGSEWVSPQPSPLGDLAAATALGTPQPPFHRALAF